MSMNTALLLVAIVLVASLATMAIVSNPAFAGVGFKNRGECIKALRAQGATGKETAGRCRLLAS
ncbi:MAG: hypothetical protein ACJ71P_00435 [Nitrososphaeraceae archaeon]